MKYMKPSRKLDVSIDYLSFLLQLKEASSLNEPETIDKVISVMDNYASKHPSVNKLDSDKYINMYEIKLSGKSKIVINQGVSGYYDSYDDLATVRVQIIGKVTESELSTVRKIFNSAGINFDKVLDECKVSRVDLAVDIMDRFQEVLVDVKHARKNWGFEDEKGASSTYFGSPKSLVEVNCYDKKKQLKEKKGKDDVFFSWTRAEMRIRPNKGKSKGKMTLANMHEKLPHYLDRLSIIKKSEINWEGLPKKTIFYAKPSMVSGDLNGAMKLLSDYQRKKFKESLHNASYFNLNNASKESLLHDCLKKLNLA